MILEIEGKRVQIDDAFGKLTPEQQEAQVAEIAKSFAPPAKETSSDNQVNPLLPTIGGAIGAQFAGPGINQGFKELSRVTAAHEAGTTPANMEWDSAGQRWARKTGFGAGEGKTVQEVDAAYKKMMAEQNAPLGRGKVASKISGPMNLQSFEVAQAQEAARQARFAEQRAMEAAALRANVPMANKAANVMGISPGAQKVAGGIYSGLSNSVPAVLGRGIAGGSAAFQGVDAYNRMQGGDYGGALIGGLGAIGSAAAMLPHPIARVGGTALGMGAEALNMYLDSLKNKNKPQGMREGGRALSPEVSFDAKPIPSMSGMPGVGYMQSPQGTRAHMQMSQPIGDGHLRAGISGMGMAIPGQQGVKLMPGEMNVGYSIPVGRGHLDISAQRAINKQMPGKEHPYQADVKYSMKFAQGGLAYIK
jgi:hypothetical protein